jgi:hypothetical protein
VPRQVASPAGGRFGVARLQGIEGLGMADPGETSGSPWLPLAIRLWVASSFVIRNLPRQSFCPLTLPFAPSAVPTSTVCFHLLSFPCVPSFRQEFPSHFRQRFYLPVPFHPFLGIGSQGSMPFHRSEASFTVRQTMITNNINN